MSGVLVSVLLPSRGRPVPLAEAVASLRDLADQPDRWHTIPKRPGEIYYLNSRADKAEQVLGWTPKVSLSEGIDRTIQIWRDR